MIPLKLTDAATKELVYINPKWIVAMKTINTPSFKQNQSPHTQVRTTEGYTFTVTENPETINNMIREQQNQAQAEAPAQDESTRRTRKERTEENPSPEEE